MARVAPSRTKINTEVTQLASRQPSRRSPGWVQLGRPARRPARVGGDARDSVRDPGRQVMPSCSCYRRVISASGRRSSWTELRG